MTKNSKISPILALNCTDCQLNLSLSPSNKRCLMCQRAKVPYGQYIVSPTKFFGLYYETGMLDKIAEYLVDDFINSGDNEPETLTLKQAKELLAKQLIKIWLLPSPQAEFYIRIVNDWGMSDLGQDFELSCDENLAILKNILKG